MHKRIDVRALPLDEHAQHRFLVEAEALAVTSLGGGSRSHTARRCRRAWGQDDAARIS